MLALVAMLALSPVSRAQAAAYNCDEAGLNAALAAGGSATFGCAAATTVTVTGTKTVSKSVNLDGGGLLTISGANARQVFSVNSGVTFGVANLTITGGNAIADAGGAIANRGGTVNVTNSTLRNNTAGNGGAINNSYSGGGGTVNVTNSTLVGNSASAYGGAIFNDWGRAATVNVTNSTIVGNSAAYYGGGIHNNGSVVALARSIVAGNSGIGPEDPNSSGGYTDNGGNLVGGTPLLATLGSHGGGTQTMPPLPGSPAIDAGGTTCPATDQRGLSRPVSTNCDIGAVESRGFTLTKTSGDNGSADVGTAFPALVATVSSAASEPVAGGAVTFTITPGMGGASGVFGTAAGCTNSMSDTVTTCTVALGGGVTSPTITANTTAGGFTVVASATGATSQTFTLTVGQANVAPVANNDSYSVAEDTTLAVSAPGVLGNDVDTTPLTAALVSGPANASSFTLNADGSFSYTPVGNFSGSDTFTYHASDGTANSNVATVTVTVTAADDAPTAVNDAATVGEDSDANAIDVLANDTDSDGGPKAVASATQPAHGTAAIVTTGPDTGKVTYTPAANYHGPDSFTYTLNGGSAATVSITVTAVNDAPVSNDQSVVTAEDTAKALTLTASDNEGDTLTYTVVAGPAHGTLSGTGASLTYTPAANYHGPDSFTFTAQDPSNATSNVATVSITVTPVNDSPVAADDSYSTNEDTALTVPQPGVLGNDTDADGNTHTAVLVASPTNGMVTLNANGSFVYTPAANHSGSDSFTYKVNDGTADSNVATVTITVTPVNDAPVADGQSITTAEDTDRAITLTATDADGNTLSYTIVSAPTHGTLSGTAPGLTYTPAANYHGPDSFTFKANDGTADSNVATVTLTVTAVNDAPVAVNDAATTAEDTAVTVAVLANDSDVENNALSVSITTAPTNGSATVNADQTVSYTPAANFFGTDSFSYTISDGNGGTATATVSVTVTSVNDDPVAKDDAATVAEDSGATAINVLANDSFAPDAGETLAVTAVGAARNGTAAFTATGVTYTPNANYSGTDSFTYTISDGNGGTATATVTLTVTAVNDAPVAANDSYSTAENTALTVATPGVLGNDTDVDGNPLTAVKVTDPANGAVTVNADGSFTYTPNLNFNGADSFTYKANDGTADSNVATVTLTVTAVNDAPTATIIGPAPYTVVAKGSTVILTGTYSDVDTTDKHKAYWTFDTTYNSSMPPGVDVTGGTVNTTYTANLPAGVYKLTLTVTDSGNLSGTATTVNGEDAYIVVYDPSAGFVTGGGWFTSQPGACKNASVCSATATGRASFGFVAKYVTGRTVPSGETEFQFKAGNLNFHSTAYDSLVISGAQAQYKGTGTINGVTGYSFMITVTDGQVTGGGGVDKFRIKIWKTGGDEFGGRVYDNTGEPNNNTGNGQAIDGGSIQIKTK